MPTTEEKKLIVEITGSVARVSLNNPPLNTIEPEMMSALRDHLTALEQTPSVTAIVFSGNERVFSAGMDVASLAPQTLGGDAQQIPRRDPRPGGEL